MPLYAFFPCAVAQTSPPLGYHSEPSQKEAAFLFVHFLLPQCLVYFFTVILTSSPHPTQLTLIFNCERNNVESNTPLTTPLL